MTSPHIRTFAPGEPEMEHFRAFAAGLYAGDPWWTPPDDPPPGEDTLCFLAYAGEEIVARACGTVNPGISLDGGRTALAGWYECIDDPAAAGALLDAVGAHFRDRGYSRLIGPMNGSTWHRYRFAEGTPEPPFFLDVYNKPWYPAQFEENGFETIATYSSTRVDPREGTYGRVERFEEIYASRGITIRPIRTDDFENELRRLHQVTLESFRENFLYTPISFESFRGIYDRIAPLIDPELVLVAESSDGRPLGYIFTITDRFDRSGRGLVVKTVAAVPGGAARGLGTFLVEKIHSVARRRGYETLIHALMHQNNSSANILSDESRPYRTYRLFGRSI